MLTLKRSVVTSARNGNSEVPTYRLIILGLNRLHPHLPKHSKVFLGHEAPKIENNQ
jgi:hypothetical protein